MRNSANAAWLLCLCLSTTLIWTHVSHAAEQDDNYELMRLFVDTFEEIDDNYVKDIDRRDLVEAAIQGMLAKLDPYSNYISPDDLASFEQDVQQEFGGIGIQVHFDPEHRELIVMTPLPGTPAYEAGIRAGDRIINIEGKDVVEFELGKELSTAVLLLKGAPGEKVELTVRHEATGPDQKSEAAQAKEESEDDVDPNVETLEITRDVIRVATVMGDRYNPDGTWNFMIDEENRIGYVRLSHFSRNSAAELQDALKELEKQDVQGLILDLRWNPGGLLTSAVEICDMFVDSGKIVSTKGRNTQERTWRAKRRGTFKDFPMAILINRFSASASEIVSACLQDHDRAVIVGERSWGKGSVQNVIELEEGSSALKLTTASYHRPSGKNIHRFPKAKPEDEWGVMPNDGFDVKLSNQEMLDYRKFRSERDVLSNNGPPESEFVDKQYKSALNYIMNNLPGSEEQKAKQDGEAQPAGKSAGKEAAEVPRRFFVVPRRQVM
ncbi:S41 family peptidase [Rubinisphaera sp. JC750]|uniref:S41 family peptidase n=1 Tax=Rubinisphaera sp. JC750 TaxID=2898658 RepID=UPI001F20C8E8|nr:S41 family peptidase [Rubinisphaera sp. JC750]